MRMVNPGKIQTKFKRPNFKSFCRYLAGVIHSDTGFYTCLKSSLYPATREQMIYGSETRLLSKHGCEPNSGTL